MPYGVPQVIKGWTGASFKEAFPQGLPPGTTLAQKPAPAQGPQETYFGIGYGEPSGQFQSAEQLQMAAGGPWALLLALGMGLLGWAGGSGLGESAQTGITTYQATQAGASPGTGGVPVGGWGVPEPPNWMIAKHWNIVSHSNTHGTFRIFFWRLIDGRMLCYNPAQKSWRVWRPKKHIILPRGTTTLSQAVKAQKYLDRLWRTAAKRTKAIKMA